MQSKHLFVERMLPLLPKPPVNGHSLVTMKVLASTRGPRPIAPKTELPEIDSENNNPSQNSSQTISTETSENRQSTSKILVENEPTVINAEILISEAQIVNTNADKVLTEVVMENTVPTETLQDPSSPTSISNFLDLDIPNQDTNDLILAATGEKGGITSFAGEFFNYDVLMFDYFTIYNIFFRFVVRR